MPLGLAVLLVVLGATAVVAALGYLIDKSAAARGPDTRNADTRSLGENKDPSRDDGGVHQHT